MPCRTDVDVWIASPILAPSPDATDSASFDRSQHPAELMCECFDCNRDCAPVRTEEVLATRLQCTPGDPQEAATLRPYAIFFS